MIESENRSLLLHWARERLLLLIREEGRKNQAEAEPGPYQMFLEGFESLSERVPILAGRQGIPLATATLMDLRKSLKFTRFRQREKNERIATLIREMEPYARTRRGLTVERYCELRAAGVTARAARKTHA